MYILFLIILNIFFNIILYYFAVVDILWVYLSGRILSFVFVFKKYGNVV